MSGTRLAVLLMLFRSIERACHPKKQTRSHAFPLRHYRTFEPTGATVRYGPKTRIAKVPGTMVFFGLPPVFSGGRNFTSPDGTKIW